MASGLLGATFLDAGHCGVAFLEKLCGLYAGFDFFLHLFRNVLHAQQDLGLQPGHFGSSDGGHRTVP